MLRNNDYFHYLIETSNILEMSTKNACKTIQIQYQK